MEQSQPIVLVVDPNESGERLDRFCTSRLEDFSRNQIQTLNARGGIAVDGRRRADSYSLDAGATVTLEPGLLTPPGLEGGEPVGEDIPVAVVFEDDFVVVVNKPAGLVVHPAHGNWSGTLVNALVGRGVRLAALGGPERPGVVHRLDKDTSGLVVLAKTDDAYRHLAGAFKRHRVDKTYHAIVCGHLARPDVTVELPLGRHPVKRQQMAVVEGSGRPARTDAFVVDTYGDFDYIRVTIFTGRTHQIRVHLSHLGHPLLGDAVYGGRRRRTRPSGAGSRVIHDRLLKILPRHALHASKLAFEHPDTGKWMAFQTALPADMRLALETMHREIRTKEA